METVDGQLSQLKKDADLVFRLDKKRNEYSIGLVLALFALTPGVIGIISPDSFLKMVACTFLVAGVLLGIMRCSLMSLAIGLGGGIASFYCLDLVSGVLGIAPPKFDVIGVLIAFGLFVFVALLPYVTTSIALMFLNLTRRNIKGLPIFKDISTLTTQEIQELSDSITNEDVLAYLKQVKDSRVSYGRTTMYSFERDKLKEIANQKSIVCKQDAIIFQPSAREKKCMDCKLKGVCPFQPGAILEHIGDKHF